jgi:hypothetical protein
MQQNVLDIWGGHLSMGIYLRRGSYARVENTDGNDLPEEDGTV